MAIPTITEYRMPRASELPESQVDWAPEPERSALLIHDMQNYFIDFLASGQPPRTELIARVRELRAAAARHGVPVFYSAQPGRMTPEQRGLLADIWGPGMRDGHEQRIVDDLRPAPEDVLIKKWRYSAFTGSDLARTLEQRGRDQLIVCGVYAHVGCLMTACDAFALDIQPFLVADAMADFSYDHHRLALLYAAERCGSVLMTSAVMRALEEAAPASREPVAVSSGSS